MCVLYVTNEQTYVHISINNFVLLYVSLDMDTPGAIASPKTELCQGPCHEAANVSLESIPTPASAARKTLRPRRSHSHKPWSELLN